MKIFKDAEGREWTVRIDIETAARIRDLTGFDPLKSKIADLSDDPYLLANVMYAACKPQADERALTDVQFGRGLVGDVIDEATDAFNQELANFFPSGRRKLMQSALTKMKAAQERAMPLIEQKMDQDLETTLQSILGPPSTSKPESSASTQPG